MTPEERQTALLEKVRRNRAARGDKPAGPTPIERLAATREWRISFNAFSPERLYTSRRVETRDKRPLIATEFDYFRELAEMARPSAILAHCAADQKLAAERYGERHALAVEVIPSWLPGLTGVLLIRPVFKH